MGLTLSNHVGKETLDWDAWLQGLREKRFWYLVSTWPQEVALPLQYIFGMLVMELTWGTHQYIEKAAVTRKEKHSGILVKMQGLQTHFLIL